MSSYASNLEVMYKICSLEGVGMSRISTGVRASVKRRHGSHHVADFIVRGSVFVTYRYSL